MKDYYIILGLPKAADKNRIKKAYRDKAKELHPDKANTPENRQKFLDAQEAYETLADDDKRADYDRKLKNQQKGSRVSVSRKSGPPPHSRRKTGRGPLEDVPFPGFTQSRQQQVQVRQLRAELVLSPEEAAAGGRFRLSVPITKRCPYCGYGSFFEQLLCPACSGQGQSHFQKPLILELAPHTPSGTTFHQVVDDSAGVRTELELTVLVESGGH